MSGEQPQRATTTEKVLIAVLSIVLVVLLVIIVVVVLPWMRPAPEPTPVAVATATPVPATEEPAGTALPTATASAVPPTDTPSPLPPTNTAVLPSATFTVEPPTATQPPPPTDAPLPPTNTAVPPTNTAVPPTNTPAPPTATPPPPTATQPPPPQFAWRGAVANTFSNCALTRLMGLTLDRNGGLAGDIWLRYWADGFDGVWVKSRWTTDEGLPGLDDSSNWDAILGTYPRDGVWYVCVVPAEGSRDCVSNTVTAQTVSAPCDPDSGGVQIVRIIFQLN